MAWLFRPMSDTTSNNLDNVHGTCKTKQRYRLNYSNNKHCITAAVEVLVNYKCGMG